MPRVSDEYKVARIGELYRATWGCVVRLGIENVTIGDIIEASGFSAGMVYNYFASKDDLMAAAFRELVRLLREDITAATSEPSAGPAELFRRVVEAVGNRGDDTMGTLWVMSIGASSTQVQESGLRDTIDFYLVELERHAVAWREDGVIGSAGTPHDDATLVLSQTLGFFAQQSLGRSADGGAAIPAAQALDGHVLAIRNLDGAGSVTA